MKKMIENKPRKATRIILCILYIVEIAFCALPYYGFVQSGKLVASSIFETFGKIGSNDYNSLGLTKFIPISILLVAIPIIGFVFCLIDKERNIKNIISLVCSVVGILLIVFGITYNFAFLGSWFALVLYTQIIQVTVLSMLARLIKGNTNGTESISNKNDL